MKTLHTLLILAICTTMTAQPTNQNTVDVTGEGVVKVVPDEVTIRVRVENTGKDPKALKETNDNVVNEVLSFLKRSGIPDKDVSTEYVRLSKNYEYNTKTYNYAANQSISVMLRDLSRYETIMNGLMESGINRIDGVAFSSSQKSALESEARKKAVANAKMKAEEYASVLNQTIGKAVSISEFRQQYTPGPMYRSAMAMESDGGAAKQTLAPGEMEIRTTVNVSFILN